MFETPSTVNAESTFTGPQRYIFYCWRYNMGLPQFNDTRNVLGQNLPNIPIEMLEISRKSASERDKRAVVGDDLITNCLIYCLGSVLASVIWITLNVPVTTCKATSIYLRP